MAKLPALVDAITEVDGRERPTIEHVARVIREAGYVPTTKRGSGAADMTAREAANLLLALNGADAPKDGPVAIDRFRSLVQTTLIGRGMTPEWVTDDKVFSCFPDAIKDVADSRTFGEALEALIQGAPGLELFFKAYVKEEFGEDHASVFVQMIDRGLIAGVTITLKRYYANICLWRNVAGEVLRDFSADFRVDVDRDAAGFYGSGSKDRNVAVTFGLPTLCAVANALSPEISGREAGGGQP